MSSDTVILFIPGLYGSRIVHRSGRTLWLAAENGFLNRHSLALPIDGSDDGDTLAKGVLDRVPVGPLYAVDVYGKFLRGLQRHFGEVVRVESFDYDWRRSVEQILPQLAARIGEERARGAERIFLIAHSMGGLLATHYLRYGGQTGAGARENWEGARNISKLVLAGVPYGGAMAVFRNALLGIRVLLNRKILDRQTYSTLQSTYSLLPYGNHDVLVDRSRREYRGMVREFTHWKENGWGLLHPSTTAPDRTVRENYTRASLSTTNRFYDEIHTPIRSTATQMPEILQITGRGRATLYSGLKMGDRVHFWAADVKRADPKFPISALHAEGDGAVAHRATIPPTYLPIKRSVESTEDHLLLLTSRSMRDPILDFLS